MKKYEFLTVQDETFELLDKGYSILQVYEMIKGKITMKYNAFRLYVRKAKQFTYRSCVMMTMQEEEQLADKVRAMPIDDPEFLKFSKKLPLAPEVALAAKEVYGVEYMRNSGFNFEQVEARYGKDWLVE